MRKALIVVDLFLTVLFGLTLAGLLTVYAGLGDDLDSLIFFVVLGVPYGLLRFILLGSPVPFTALPSKPE
ncbi:MAG: hypothetical protein ISQ57_07565 [Litoricola sp.]|jgi:hypothetical protein|nr:hypothetical protein [Litorivicinus sp.]